MLFEKWFGLDSWVPNGPGAHLEFMESICYDAGLVPSRHLSSHPLHAVTDHRVRVQTRWWQTYWRSLCTRTPHHHTTHSLPIHDACLSFLSCARVSSVCSDDSLWGSQTGTRLGLGHTAECWGVWESDIGQGQVQFSFKKTTRSQFHFQILRGPSLLSSCFMFFWAKITRPRSKLSSILSFWASKYRCFHPHKLVHMPFQPHKLVHVPASPFHFRKNAQKSDAACIDVLEYTNAQTSFTHTRHGMFWRFVSAGMCFRDYKKCA